MQHSPWHEAIKSHLPEGIFTRSMTLWMKSIAKEWFIHRVTRSLRPCRRQEMDQVKVLILRPRSLLWTGSSAGLKFFCSGSCTSAAFFAKYSQRIALRYRKKRSHDLTSWAEQGVLLLNACLTVPAGQANGHAGQIWGAFHRCCDQGGLMSWRSLLSLSSGDLMPVRKKPLITKIDIWSLNQAHQVLIGLPRILWFPTLFKKPINFWKRRDASRLIG